MAHIHELIDFVVSAYIVHDGKVLLVHHKKLNTWPPVGGHVELDEDTDTALIREIEEEAGLMKEDLEFIDKRPAITDTKFLLTPQYVDIHRFNDVHRYLCMNYFVRARTGKIKHNVEEHNSIKWFSEKELEDGVPSNVVFLSKEAIKTLNSM